MHSVSLFVLYPVEYRLFLIFGPVLAEPRHERAELGWGRCLHRRNFFVGGNRYPGCELRVFAALPVYLFVKLKNIALSAITALKQIPPPMALLDECLDQRELGRKALFDRCFGVLPKYATLEGQMCFILMMLLFADTAGDLRSWKATSQDLDPVGMPCGLPAFFLGICRERASLSVRLLRSAGTLASERLSTVRAKGSMLQ